MRMQRKATSTSTCGRFLPTARCRGRNPTRCSLLPTTGRPSATRSTSPCGRARSRASRRGRHRGDRDGTGAIPEPFAAAMNDDLAVSRALGVVHDTVRAGNTALADGDKETLASAYAAVVAMTDVLGLAPRDYATGSDESSLHDVVD